MAADFLSLVSRYWTILPYFYITIHIFTPGQLWCLLHNSLSLHVPTVSFLSEISCTRSLQWGTMRHNEVELRAESCSKFSLSDYNWTVFENLHLSSRSAKYTGSWDIQTLYNAYLLGPREVREDRQGLEVRWARKAPWGHLVRVVLVVPLVHPFREDQVVAGEGEVVVEVVGVGVVEERVDNIVHYKKEHRMRDILADTDWGFFCSAVVVLQQRKKKDKHIRIARICSQKL